MLNKIKCSGKIKLNAQKTNIYIYKKKEKLAENLNKPKFILELNGGRTKKTTKKYLTS